MHAAFAVNIIESTLKGKSLAKQSNLPGKSPEINSLKGEIFRWSLFVYRERRLGNLLVTIQRTVTPNQDNHDCSNELETKIDPAPKFARKIRRQ
jgi:hypothetical protein